MNGKVYVYHIRHHNNVLYVGCAQNPISRETYHNSRLKNMVRHHIFSYTGPFERHLGFRIEASEIARHRTDHLLNAKSPNKIYIPNLAIEKFNKKTITILRKGGKKHTCSPEIKDLILNHKPVTA